MPDIRPDSEAGASHASAAHQPVSIGWRATGGSWTTVPFAEAGSAVSVTETPGGGTRIVVTRPGAAAVEIAFAVPAKFQAFGGGERFETLDLRGQSVRFYLENFGLGNGTYLPSPWIATTLGYSLFLPDEAPAVFHIAAPFDPHVLRVQVEGESLTLDIDRGGLAELYAALIARIGPPLMPDTHFFGLWKAGDWRYENATTVAADVAGHAALELPMAIKLIDAYWASEVHSFAFDTVKYPDAWGMVSDMAKDGTGIYLWLCPWVVVGTKSFDYARSKGYVIVDRNGELITRRPGANPNVVAALIDFSNPEASAWWSGNLRGLIERGIVGFKADFGEQLPEHAVLHSGETGGRAHNAFVRYYLEATIAAFDGKTPAIISRSSSPRVRAPIWSGDQTSDFCPKTGLPSAVRAVQSANLSGWSFIGSDLGGYFGTPTPQVFARWTQFACFTPLMMLHGLGCREPWDMDAGSAVIYADYARLHLALRPIFGHYGREAANGGLPLLRMMPLAFPNIDWGGINDWDQQFMLGPDILVAPVAFYGNTRAVYLPDGDWYDVLAEEWVSGPAWRVHDVPLDKMPLFLRDGARLTLAQEVAGQGGRAALGLIIINPDRHSSVDATPGFAPDWRVDHVGIVGAQGRAAPDASVTHQPAMASDIARWFGKDIRWISSSAEVQIGPG
ncbi:MULTISPECIES: TIM-barrel domain-containing protein [unclassified Chelatococcus]|uniref:TIM-barrel domain-containing protein n=1 Tax=unclassified Chelatococcus TaxID=2638111 RepID=UPI001BCFBBEB|nr:MULTISPECIES: TIM-barrel domain-containing protein [unclassified Chelatococcus]MBS7700694.1 glycoside hydrolase family 31 protein [Chelatococcus sp. YT9]MBX3559125.1 glycoside hydrolase family 31 protein [Chelatococcus sp.]